MEATPKVRFAVNAALMLVFIGLVTRTNAQGTNCTRITAGISACAGFLNATAGINIPSRECCSGLQNIAQASVTIGLTSTCGCIRASAPLANLTQFQVVGNLTALASANTVCRILSIGSISTTVRIGFLFPLCLIIRA